VTTTEITNGLNFAFTDEQEALRSMVHEFVERECPKPVARQLEESGVWPTDLYRRMAEADLTGIGIPEEYGGQGGGIIEQMIVAEELARSLAGLTWSWGATNFSGAKSVGLHGTEEQKATMLPKMASGELTFTIAMTEANGGTDALRAMRTRAKPVDGGFVINGTKMWSTGAHVADRILLVARTSESERPSNGITLFLVDPKAPGVSVVPIPKLGMRAIGSNEVIFKDVFVSEEDILGAVDHGWHQLLGSLNNERVMVAAICTGIIRGVLEDAVRYALEREAFGKPIGSFQALQHGIADIKMRLEAAQLLTYRAAWMQERGIPCGVESGIAKALTAEWAVLSADYGIQVLGGYGYSLEYDMQRYWRDARLYRITPISNEMVRNHVGESLGLPRSF
jgi:alkylation response protein AidB-like acyl-CoA dehydrogenase